VPTGEEGAGDGGAVHGDDTTATDDGDDVAKGRAPAEIPEDKDVVECTPEDEDRVPDDASDVRVTDDDVDDDGVRGLGGRSGRVSRDLDLRSSGPKPVCTEGSWWPSWDSGRKPVSGFDTRNVLSLVSCPADTWRESTGGCWTWGQGDSIISPVIRRKFLLFKPDSLRRRAFSITPVYTLNFSLIHDSPEYLE